MSALTRSASTWGPQTRGPLERGPQTRVPQTVVGYYMTKVEPIWVFMSLKPRCSADSWLNLTSGSIFKVHLKDQSIRSNKLI